MSVDSTWETVGTLPVNALITGMSGVRQSALAAALARTPRDVHFYRVTASLDWVAPEFDSGTLVLDDVQALSVAAQQSLLRWMEERGRQVRIVALAECPLFDLVEQGRFRSDLYYRLCIVQASA
jgi:transcriptional regulator with AAA-type ATPase domain